MSQSLADMQVCVQRDPTDHRIKTMNAVNAVQLFILVWTFTAVCQADDDIGVICENVTGTVREEVTFTCNVTLKCTAYCITLYKFKPEINNSTEICRQNYPCERRNSFTCRYTPTTAMTEQFRFFVQTTCGSKKTLFTVNITETPSSGEDHASTAENRTGSNHTVVAAVVSGFIIIILIIITIIYKRKSNSSTPRGV